MPTVNEPATLYLRKTAYCLGLQPVIDNFDNRVGRIKRMSVISDMYLVTCYLIKPSSEAVGLDWNARKKEIINI